MTRLARLVAAITGRWRYDGRHRARALTAETVVLPPNRGPAMSHVYDNHEITYVRTDELREGDRLAKGRALEDGGYTARPPVVSAGWAGRHPQWGEQDLTRVETADGHAFRQPGHIKVSIVRREVR